MTPSSFLFSLSVGFFLLGLRHSLSGSGLWDALSRSRREKLALKETSMLLHEFEETLEAGLLPAASRWGSVRALPAPWGELADQSLRELRANGGALLPTLKRLRHLADQHLAALSDARAKSAQAQAQALACALLVPVFGGALFLLLPGVSDRPWTWIFFCVLSTFSAGAGAIWLLLMSERARWAGLKPEHRSWVLEAQCAGERFLALVRSGLASDLAWARSVETLSQTAMPLARAWGFSVFQSAEARLDGSVGNAGAAFVLAEAGQSMRRAIHFSLMEGRPCTERVESVLQSVRNELRSAVDRELVLLGTRALQPLFLLVAPALLALLAAGLWIGWKDIAS